MTPIWILIYTICSCGCTYTEPRPKETTITEKYTEKLEAVLNYQNAIQDYKLKRKVGGGFVCGEPILYEANKEVVK